MTDQDFEKWREDFCKEIRDINLDECLRVRVNALTPRQMELLQNDLDLRIDYLKQGPKSSAEAFEAIMKRSFDYGTEGKETA